MPTNDCWPTGQEPQTHFIVRLLESPLLIDPDRARSFLAGLEALAADERFAHARMGAALNAQNDFWSDSDPFLSSLRPYNVDGQGTLQIPVMGALINRFSYQVGSYATGYTYLEKALERGLADESVARIAFIVDSPGGEASGAFELADKLFASRGAKPMQAFVADAALSAAYLMAAAVGPISVTRSGATGSVGVVSQHQEISKMLEQRGVKVTLVHAGARKIDGNSVQPLSDPARESMQARVDKLYDVFTSTIARYREMRQNAVQATEARVYDADESLEVGFADNMGAIEEELASFAEIAAGADDEQSPEGPEPETDEMTKPDATPSLTQADVDAAVALATETGMATERARFSAVLASEHYAGREAMAAKMLGDPACAEMSAASIIAVLQSAPAAPAPAPVPAPTPTPTPAGDHFAAAMNAEGGPDVGSDDGGGTSAPVNRAARALMAAGRAATK